MSEIETDRLFLRGWRDADREPFAPMNANPIVMDFDHPHLPPGHPMRRHVLYRLRRMS